MLLNASINSCSRAVLYIDTTPGEWDPLNTTAGPKKGKETECVRVGGGEIVKWKESNNKKYTTKAKEIMYRQGIG